MQYLEENIARDLYHDLTQRFKNADPSISCSLEGWGIHWHCIVKHDRHDCRIECFDECGVPQYCISFREDSKNRAGGRTFSKLETLNAVEVWIQGGKLSLLYQQFPFVDRYRRDLIRIGKNLLTVSPQLSSRAKIKPGLAHQDELWFEDGDRFAYVGFYQDSKGEKVFQAAFRWGTPNSSVLLSIETLDYQRLASVLKRWVCDHALPSEIRVEFPWVKLDDLADFYEQGTAHEGELLRSWDSTIRFYESHRMWLGEPLTNRILELMETMRKEGYDRKVSAEQAHYQLILRSQKNGYLCLHPEYDSYDVSGTPRTIQSLQVSYHFNGSLLEEFEEDEIALTSRIRTLLQKLSNSLQSEQE